MKLDDGRLVVIECDEESVKVAAYADDTRTVLVTRPHRGGTLNMVSSDDEDGTASAAFLYLDGEAIWEYRGSGPVVKFSVERISHADLGRAYQSLHRIKPGGEER